MSITIGCGHNAVTLTEGEVRQVLSSGNVDVASLVMYAAIVGMKLRDDYNISMDTLPQWGAYAMIHDCWTDGNDSTATCAWRLANANAKGKLRSEGGA